MVKELLSRVIISNRHIAFILLFLLSTSPVLSQSVLLPADVVVVTVNSSGDSFDFITLVPLEIGTSIWFSSGLWNSESLEIIGDEVEIVIQTEIEAGTNIHVNEVEDPRIEVRGHLDFKSDGNRLFVYQKDEGISRVIFGVVWGNPEVWNAESDEGLSIPVSITKETNSFLQLGLDSNYQYYLRNGASGTPSMLASFVSDPSKWKGNNSAFPSFGTTFRILRPPVILFNESISTIKEGEPIILNVAIYEHDGSKLTVDAIFNTNNSLSDTNDVKGFDKYTFNFTGLIGDAVYAIEIPTENDLEVEGDENAFFELQNISDGNLGDFVSHVAFIQDDEIPSVQISGISYTGNPDSDFIEIQNNEQIEIDISGWQFVSRDIIFEFKQGTYLPISQTLKVVKNGANSVEIDRFPWFTRNSGTLELKTSNGILISQSKYRKTAKEEETVNSEDLSNSEVPTQKVSIPEFSASLINSSTQNRVAKQTKKAGWYVIDKEEANGKESFIWNEATKSFEPYDPMLETETSNFVRIAFLDEEEIQQKDSRSETDTSETNIDEFVDQELRISIMGTDSDKNGVINGAEGFNFLKNTTRKAIQVQSLLEAVENEVYEGAVYPYVFLWKDDGNGWMTSQKLSDSDLIPTQSVFWVRADSVFDRIDFSTNISANVEGDNRIDRISEFNSKVGISIQAGIYKKDISINLFDEGQEFLRNVITPELEPELRIETDEFLFFGAGTGKSWNSEINLKLLEDQKMVFPLTFETSESGTITLSISNWINIPVDWKIMIEDLEMEKMYELNQNWTLAFDYLKEKNRSERSKEIPIPEIDPEEGGVHRFNLVITPPGIAQAEAAVPEEISLTQNYPNPFNPTTTISFYLPEPVLVKLSIFNVVGQPVSILSEGTLGAGDHEFEWDATGLPSGMYIYQLEVGNKVLTRKMTLVK